MHKRIGFIMTLLFLGVLAADIVLISFHMEQYRIYTKPLLVPLVTIPLLLCISSHRGLKPVILVAFFFCFAGDILLMKDADNAYFMGGLLSFLVAHICLIVFFLRLYPPSLAPARLTLLVAGGIAIYVFLLLYVLWDHIDGSLRLPVTVYAVVLGLMLLTAVNLFRDRSLQSRPYFMAGAVSFVLSDSILAIGRFYAPLPGEGVVVMFTYGAAIFLIAGGARRVLCSDRRSTIPAI